MVFNVIAANVDDHIKNFSFLMDEKAAWHITPAYDLTFTTHLVTPYWAERIDHHLRHLSKQVGIHLQ